MNLARCARLALKCLTADQYSDNAANLGSAYRRSRFYKRTNLRVHVLARTIVWLLAALATIIGTVSQATVSDVTLTGTVSGIDGIGLFGPPGAALDGATFTAIMRWDLAAATPGEMGGGEEYYGGSSYGSPSPIVSSSIQINGITVPLYASKLAHEIHQADSYMTLQEQSGPLDPVNGSLSFFIQPYNIYQILGIAESYSWTADSMTGGSGLTGTLSINDANSTVTTAALVPLTISVYLPITVSPASLVFGTQGVNTASPTQNVMLSNASTTALPISNIQISGEFSQSNYCGATVPAGGSCTILVGYAPKTQGAHAGQLTITLAGLTPYTVALTGDVAASVKADPGVVGVGTPVTVSWSSAAGASCTATGGAAGDSWSGTLGSSGSTIVTESATGTYKYTLTCVLNGRAASSTTTVIVEPTAATPVQSPGAGIFTAPQTVTLADSTPGAVIYFTLDGSTPTTASTRYTTGLLVSQTLTVKALAVAAGYINSTLSSATYSISAPSSSSVTVDLKSAATIDAVATSGKGAINGGLDGGGNAYASDLLGSTVIWSGSTFAIGNSGIADAVSGGTLTFAQGKYSSIRLLATAANGNQINQSFVVTYTDGSTKIISQSLSDWHTPQSYAGESKAVTMAYRLTPTGATKTGPYYLYGYTFKTDPTKTVKTLGLPSNRKVVVLAISLIGATTATTPISLVGVFNVHALFNDGAAVTAGGLDGSGNAYSANLLGKSLSLASYDFTFGSSGLADAVTGGSVALSPGKFTTLKILATAAHGNQLNQHFIVNYADGTSTTFIQSMSDWHTPQGYTGESTAKALAYRLNPSGVASNAGPYYLYAYSMAINGAKQISSVTLPPTRNVVILAMTLGN